GNIRREGRREIVPDSVTRGPKWQPARVAHGIGVAVAITELDPGDGTPEIVTVLCIPGRDARICHRDVRQREESRILRERVVLLERERLGHLSIQDHRWAVDVGVVRPEIGDLGLVGRARRAVDGAERLDLVVRRCISRAIELWWAWRLKGSCAWD